MVYPAMYTPCVHPLYTHPVHPPYTPPYTTRLANTVISGTRAVGLGGFRIVLLPLKTVTDTSRLHRRLALTTCVCQAKSLFRPEYEKYSARQKETLPQIRSLFGPPRRHLPEPARECWREQKETFRAKETFSLWNVFQAKCS